MVEGVAELNTIDELLRVEELDKNDELLCAVKELSPGLTRLLSEDGNEDPVSDDTVTVVVKVANTEDIDDRAVKAK